MDPKSKEIEMIVNTLLEVGDEVLEISKDYFITGIWHSKHSVSIISDQYIGKEIINTPKEAIIIQCFSRIKKGFETRRSSYNEHTVIIDNLPITYSVRILPIHPDKDFLFIVVENLSKKEGFELVEDKWKLALDAAGDGVFDINIETGEIVFSEKWNELSGYNAEEIKTVIDWKNKIHPIDLIDSYPKFTDCINGLVPSYNSELRFLCKDGTYKWILSRGIVISRDTEGKALRFIGTHTDINERKTAEEKYVATAQLLSKLIDNLHSGILVTDENDKVLFANQMFCDLFEIKGAPESLIGSDVNEGLETRKLFFAEEQQFFERTKNILKRKELVIGEEWQFKNGRTLSRDYMPVFLNENNFWGIWQLRDISAQKQIERKVEEQRHFYEKILNHIPADIAVFDTNHAYLFVNKNAFKNDELRNWMVGKTDIDYARRSGRPDSFVRKRFELYDRAVSARGGVEMIEKMTNKDGNTEHHLRILTPLFQENGDLELLLAYGLDITELIVAQEALKTSMETFSSAFEYSGIGMALVSPFGHWLDMNSVIIKLTGYTKEELQKLTFQEIAYIDDREKDVELLKQMLRKDITTYTIEKRYISKDKRIIWVSLTVSMVWNSDDTPKFFIAQILDITPKKELESEINKRNTELEATKVNLINKVKQLEELSYIIAHNLRGAAGNIKAISGAMVARNKGGKFAEENPLSGAFTDEEAMAFIEESSISLMGSLSTLMKITEIKLNNRIPYNICNVEKIINDIINQLHSLIYEKKAIINLDIQFPQISYPKAYLENILYNLISNALKYSRSDIQPVILVTTRMAGDKIQIIVKDNGLGIDMDKYGNLVFKLNNVFHKGADSKGVGLYITKTQVESLGGTIELVSNVDEGCEFTVTLGS